MKKKKTQQTTGPNKWILSLENLGKVVHRSDFHPKWMPTDSRLWNLTVCSPCVLIIDLLTAIRIRGLPMLLRGLGPNCSESSKISIQCESNTQGFWRHWYDECFLFLPQHFIFLFSFTKAGYSSLKFLKLGVLEDSTNSPIYNLLAFRKIR